MKHENSARFARQLDKADPLKAYRSKFHIPKINGKRSHYFTGNSLGLQPKTTNSYIQDELKDWAQLGVEGHLHGKRPWLYYHHFTKKALAAIVGAKPIEVVAMHQLTVNLHLMMISFYQPTPTRYKIIMEAGAFPSDQYAVETQIKFHGFDPGEALIELEPRAGEHALRTEDILAAIHQHKDQLALVLFSGVQYYTGQFFDIRSITQAGHQAGAYVGFDLAHAVGNVPLQLHRDQVDFAVWCSYKYLNSGPGSVAGAFVHEKHAHKSNLPRLAGWWGHNEKERFLMQKGFKPIPGIDGWQLSNFPVLAGAPHLASLEIFQEAGMKVLRKKSLLLTGYLEFLLKEIDPVENHFTILTPADPKQRGCQLSLFFHRNGKRIFQALTKAGVIGDWREPNVIRVAPVPLYNSFMDVYSFASVLQKALR
ncbi:MAG: kynureninase [Cyclobacteriaceae bacterium]|nr:kynureninase [Cyclobacteriaceae bacterium]